MADYFQVKYNPIVVKNKRKLMIAFTEPKAWKLIIYVMRGMEENYSNKRRGNDNT